MSEKYTLRARRAAVRVDKQYEAWYLDDAHHRPHALRPERLKTLAAIIDHDTGLPELKARIDQLEVEKVEAKALLERSAILLKEWSQAYRTTLAKSENDKD